MFSTTIRWTRYFFEFRRVLEQSHAEDVAAACARLSEYLRQRKFWGPFRSMADAQIDRDSRGGKKRARGSPRPGKDTAMSDPYAMSRRALALTALV